MLFLQDDVLTVIRRVDENWAEGMLADKIGIFPISYVEVSLSVDTSVVLVFCLASQSEVCNLHIQESPRHFSGYARVVSVLYTLN